MAYPFVIVSRLVKNKMTYPSWSTDSVYALSSTDKKDHTEVYYTIRGNRKISRNFPRTLFMTPSLTYALGLLKGEGSNALGKSNYRRFTITNSDPSVIRFLLHELDRTGLVFISELKIGSLHLLHHTHPDEEAIDYWSDQLRLPKNLFKTFDDKTKTTPYGVCHVYLSDVLLRRVVDLLHEKLMITL